MGATKGNRGRGADTPTRPIRVDPALWERFGTAAALNETDRSQAIREFMAWYARDHGAKMPKRPDAI